MGWEDRDYSSEEYGGRRSAVGDVLRRLGEFFDQSFPIGTYLGIRVRVHILFIMLVVFQLLLPSEGQTAFWVLRWTSLLFISVLLHEFGHCLACRAVGGTADDILMWPLGGLASCSPPKRPWAEFVTVIWGPMVNVIIAGICYAVLWFAAETMPVTLNPLIMWTRYEQGVLGLVADLFVVNYALLLFNLLLVFIPFDGGRLVQIGLWKMLDYKRSMVIATRVGMVGAVVVFFYALAVRKPMLVFIAVYGFLKCYEQGMMLRYGMLEEEEDGPRFDPGFYDQRDQDDTPGFFARRRDRKEAIRQRRQAEANAREEGQLDALLAKISEQGMGSLTDREKRTLDRLSARKRKSH